MSERVAVIESQFLLKYDTPENGITVGGTQRYAHYLGLLLKELGFDVYFLTKACKEYTLQYEDIGIIKALSAPKGTLGNKSFSKKVYDFCNMMNAQVVCYSDLQIGYWYCYKPSFALQHGIDWDGPEKSIKTRIQNHEYICAARKYKRIVCVDTNYINWAREKDKSVFKDPSRMVYVPNFADESLFKYKESNFNHNGPFNLLYPRRLVAHRGYDIFIEMCEKLYSDGYNINPVLAFEDFADTRFVEMTSKYNCKFEVRHPTMSEIVYTYYDAFLTYVPTKWSEGTSLSAIEAMSTGCPVIASNVGGLGNIIIPGFNGDLVSPDVDSFVNATKKVLDNPELRFMWAQNCKTVSCSFGLNRWKEKLTEVITDIISSSKEK